MLMRRKQGPRVDLARRPLQENRLSPQQADPVMDDGLRKKENGNSPNPHQRSWNPDHNRYQKTVSGIHGELEPVPSTSLSVKRIPTGDQNYSTVKLPRHLDVMDRAGLPYGSWQDLYSCSLTVPISAPLQRRTKQWIHPGCSYGRANP